MWGNVGPIDTQWVGGGGNGLTMVRRGWKIRRRQNSQRVASQRQASERLKGSKVQQLGRFEGRELVVAEREDLELGQGLMA